MDMKQLFGLVGLAGVLLVLAAVLSHLAPGAATSVITNFEECVAAGNPVMESYPRQCNSADGRHFVEELPMGVPAGDMGGTMPADGEAMQFNGCAVAGCSGELCVSADEAENIVSTCIYKPEYTCYREASCEPQADDTCGWTMTPELTQCLANPPQEETELQVI
jgi:hypothetical protein